jgi:hypothetical protein
LLFRSKEDAGAWCERTGAPAGELLTLEQTWDLSRRWYGERLRPEFHGRTLEQAQAIFRAVGLTSPFWSGAPPQ